MIRKTRSANARQSCRIVTFVALLSSDVLSRNAAASKLPCGPSHFCGSEVETHNITPPPCVQSRSLCLCTSMGVPIVAFHFTFVSLNRYVALSLTVVSYRDAAAGQHPSIPSDMCDMELEISRNAASCLAVVRVKRVTRLISTSRACILSVLLISALPFFVPFIPFSRHRCSLLAIVSTHFLSPGGCHLH